MNDRNSAVPPAQQDGPAWAAASWLGAAHELALPAEVVDAARTCLIDWFACTLGGLHDPLVAMLQRRLAVWSPSGSALLLTGGNSAPAFVALLHSASAHTTDFDDTHIWTDAHFSGPTWVAVLSQLNGASDTSDAFLCKAFVAGFETGTKLGGRRLGHAMVHRGFQATAMLGRLSAAAACSVMADLDAQRTAMALTIAGCQTAGLSIAAGSMMKPFQGGKTAFDGVIASELAAEGFTADPSLFEKGGGAIGSKRIGGLARAFVQDGFAEFAHPDFAAGWEILRNSTKAYPCLHGIGPVIDAARDLSAKIAGRRIVKVRAYVGPSLPKIARYDRPKTSHEGRFSIQYCAALGLLDRPFTADNFEPEVMHSDEMQHLIQQIEVVTVEGRKMYNSAVDATLESGEVVLADVLLGRGHPGRPLSANELEDKFNMLVEPVLGASTRPLISILRDFPGDRTIQRAFQCVRQVHLSA